MNTELRKEKESMFLGLITFAMTIAHYDQKRKNDDKMPYAIHPMMVAMNPYSALNMMLSGWELLYARTVALLHDVIEDCKEENIARAWEYLLTHTGRTGVLGYDKNLFNIIPADGKNVKGKMLARVIDYCLDACGLSYRTGDINSMSIGGEIVSIIDELTVPKGDHPDGHYKEGDKKARKAWERSYGRMRKMSKIALCVTFNDKVYNMRSPMPGRDPTAAMMGYGEYLDNILYVLSTHKGIAVTAMPDDVWELMDLYRNK